MDVGPNVAEVAHVASRWLVDTKRTKHTKPTDRATILTFAGRAEIDPRTARRILAEGVDVIRSEAIRERAARVLAEMGLVAGTQAA